MSKAYIVYEDNFYTEDVDGEQIPMDEVTVIGVFTKKELAHSAIKEAARDKAADLVVDGKYDSEEEDNNGWRICVKVYDGYSKDHWLKDISYTYYCSEIELDTILKEDPS